MTGGAEVLTGSAAAAAAGADAAEAAASLALSCAGGGGGGESSSPSCDDCSPAVTIAGGASADMVTGGSLEQRTAREHRTEREQGNSGQSWSEFEDGDSSRRRCIDGPRSTDPRERAGTHTRPRDAEKVAITLSFTELLDRNDPRALRYLYCSLLLISAEFVSCLILVGFLPLDHTSWKGRSRAVMRPHQRRGSHRRSKRESPSTPGSATRVGSTTVPAAGCSPRIGAAHIRHRWPQQPSALANRVESPGSALE